MAAIAWIIVHFDADDRALGESALEYDFDECRFLSMKIFEWAKREHMRPLRSLAAAAAKAGPLSLPRDGPGAGYVAIRRHDHRTPLPAAARMSPAGV